MIDMRQNHQRRKGEANGRICWMAAWTLVMEILIVLSLMMGSALIGYDYGKRRGEVVLRDVPVSEYKVKGRK